MRLRTTAITLLALLFLARPLAAQDLGPHFIKLSDGIYVYAKDGNSNCTIILT